MPSSAPIITLSGLDAAINGNTVLRDITLEIPHHARIGVIGSNGSGKSTLLGLLAGSRWPAPGKGSRRYDFGAGPERDAVTARQRLSLIGHELQDLYVARSWNFRVVDVVLSGLTRSDIPKRHRTRAMIDEALGLLERASLDHLAERRILELSRGEQRRVLITRAFAFRPAVLLLDEPMSGLDAQSRQQLEATLEVLARATPLVIAAHNEADLPACINAVCSVAAGRLSPLRDRPHSDHASSEDEPTRATATATATATNQLAALPPDGLAQALPATPPPAGASQQVIIELRAASAYIDGSEVLRAVNWQLRQGEHWLIEGPNGSGKSTLLRMLHGEIRPARGGTIRWPGLGNPSNVWALRRRVTLVSAELQARYRYPTTVFQAVASGFYSSIGLTRRLQPEQRDRVLQLLNEFELEDFSGRLLSELSYGQRHRTLIARTLTTEPDVLLLDEPWEGLDRDSIALIRNAVIRRMNDGTQVVCASHTGSGGLPLNRYMRINAGRISGASIVSDDDNRALRENSGSALSRATDFRQH